MKDAAKLEGMYKESRALKMLSHTNIIKLYHSFRHESNVVLIMEYASGGELKKYVTNKHYLSEIESRKIFNQIVDAIAYCHGRYIIHRDIKLQNILFKSDTDKTVKVIDFGIAGTNYKAHKSNAGSLTYMAPELFEGPCITSPSIDIWSMGIVLYAMIYGEIPFNGKTDEILIDAIMHQKLHFPADRIVSPEVKALLNLLLEKDKSKRIKMHEIGFHEWFNVEYVIE